MSRANYGSTAPGPEHLSDSNRSVHDQGAPVSARQSLQENGLFGVRQSQFVGTPHHTGSQSLYDQLAGGMAQSVSYRNQSTPVSSSSSQRNSRVDEYAQALPPNPGWNEEQFAQGGRRLNYDLAMSPGLASQTPLPATRSSSIPLTLTSPPESSHPPGGSLITHDLHHRVVKDFDLSPPSQSRLQAFTQLMSRVPGLTKETAVPLFYILGSNLHTHDLLARQVTDLPTIEEMKQLVEKLDNRLDPGDNFTLSRVQKENLRTMANQMVFDKKYYELTTFSKVLMKEIETAVKANNTSKSFGLSHVFSNPVAVNHLQSALGRLSSSVTGSLRESVLTSLNLHPTKMQPAPMSLARFVHFAASKFKVPIDKVTQHHAIRLALMRRFVLDNRKLVLKKQPEVPRPQKRRRSNGANASDEDSCEEDSDLEPQTSPSNDNTASGNTTDSPIGRAFWSVWEWYIERLKVKMGGDLNAPAWKSFIEDTIAKDRSEYPDYDDLELPRMAEILGVVACTSESTSRISAVAPSVGVPGTTLVPNVQVGYDNISI